MGWGIIGIGITIMSFETDEKADIADLTFLA
jgi:hypothetical protein